MQELQRENSTFGGIPVPVITIDDNYEKYCGDNVSFIKMDIEVAEFAVLEGAWRVIREYWLEFAIESHHFIDGQQAYGKLERQFAEIRYYAHTSFWQYLITSADPASSAYEMHYFNGST